MTEALLEIEVPSATGAVFSDWSIDEGERVLPRIYFGPDLWLGFPGDYLLSNAGATDPGAQRRSFSSQTVDLAKNLSRFATVAKMMIPGLRDMTVAEKGNLRRYYKNVYRKV